MAMRPGTRVRLNQNYAATATEIIPAGTIGAVQKAYQLGDQMRYVVAFDAIEAVLFRRDLELVAGQLAPC